MIIPILFLAKGEVTAQGTWTNTNLSLERFDLSAASVGTKVFFAGGYGVGGSSNVVDIFDNSTGTWSTSTLSQARFDLAATSVGTKVFFAGGFGGGSSNVVDIFDNSTGTWSTIALSQARSGLSAASVGTKVFFAGGYNADGPSNVVDIFDNSTGSWATTTLSQARYDLSATSSGVKVFFAGGYDIDGSSNVVDIFDNSTGNWSTATFSQARHNLSAISVGTKVFFAGGFSSSSSYSNVIDIYDISTGTWSTTLLSQARYNLSATSSGAKVFFAGGYDIGGSSNVVDIFDNSTGTLSTSTLSQARYNLSATSVGGKVFFGGGYSYSFSSISSIVDIYDIEMVTDVIAPTVLLYSPADNATAVTNNVNLVIVFSENIQKGVGNIYIKENGTIAQTIPISDSRVLVSASTVTIIPTALPAGAVTVEVDAGAFIDVANNNYAGITSPTIWNFASVDNVAPTVTITSMASDPTNVSPIPVTFTFSESVIGFVQEDIAVTNGTVGSFTGTGTTYTASITPTAVGIVTVNIAAAKATDAATNNNTTSNTLSRTFDVAPTITITSTTTDPTNFSPIPVIFTFNENVTGFVLSDITVTNGTAGAFTGSGSTYMANITPTLAGAVSVSVAAGKATDAAYNTNIASNTLSITYDNVAPTVAIASTSSDPTNISPITFTITFSESVTGFVVSDITVTNGTAGSFAGSESTYTAGITPTATGTVTVSVAAAKATDAATNSNAASNTFSMIYDNSPPVLDAENTPSFVTSGSSINLTARLSDPQSNVTGAQVNYRSVTNSTIVKSVTLSKISSDWVGNIPSSDIGELGIEYKFEVINGAGLVLTTPYKLVRVEYPSFTIPYSSFGSNPSSFRMISVPLDLKQSTVADVFSDELGAYDKFKWRLFRYTSLVTELTSSTPLKPGEGYWLIVKDKPGRPLNTGSGMSVETTLDNPKSIQLTAGWNQIGNPYPFNLLWQDVVDANPALTAESSKVLWLYEDGEYNDKATILSKGEGAFIRVPSSTNLKFPVTKNNSANGGRVADEASRNENSIDSDNWELILSVHQGERKNEYSGIGMKPDALEGFDKYDGFSPPRFIEYLEMKHNKTHLNDALAKDIVPTSESHTWRFTVESGDENEFATIKWPNSSFSESEKEMFLIDEDEKVSVNMRFVNSYAFKTPTKFKIIFGINSYLAKEMPEGVSKILSVSPNPSKDAMKIIISLPGWNRNQPVNLEIINSLGKKLSQIYTGNLISGTHEVIWNGLTKDGERPASGFYYLKLVYSEGQSVYRVLLE